MESQPQNPEFRNNPENLQPCVCVKYQNLVNLLIKTYLLLPLKRQSQQKLTAFVVI